MSPDIKALSLALCEAKVAEDPAVISDATSKLETELVKFVGSGSLYGEFGEVPRVIVDMCGGEDIYIW